MAAHNTGWYGGNDRARGSQSLPPIRDFLGDQLTLPLPWQPREDARIGFAHRERRDAETSWHSQSRARAFTLPSRSDPRETPAYAPRPTSSRSLPSYRRNTSPFPAPLPAPTTPPSAYSYHHVLRESRSGGLVTTVPIRHSRSRAAFPPVPPPQDVPAASTSTSTRAENEDARRHVCPICHKRFNRPSSVRTHQSVHTGSRPFSCPHPGCNKVFSVASNMRRHLRSYDHDAGGADDGDEEELDDEEEHEGEDDWTSRYDAS